MSDAKLNLVLGVVLAAGASWFLWASSGFPVRARYMPNAAGFLLLGASLLLIAVAAHALTNVHERDRKTFFVGFNLKMWIGAVVPLVGFYLGMRVIGFYESLILFSLVVTYVVSVGTYGPKQALRDSALFTAGLTVVMYFLFTTLLNVPLGRGLIF